MLPVLAFHGGYDTPAWQSQFLTVLFVVGFALPAVWIGFKAHHRGEDWRPWFFLTLVGSVIGVWQYRMHVRITERKARRAAAAATGADGGQPDAAGAREARSDRSAEPPT